MQTNTVSKLQNRMREKKTCSQLSISKDIQPNVTAATILSGIQLGTFRGHSDCKMN